MQIGSSWISLHVLALLLCGLRLLTAPEEIESQVGNAVDNGLRVHILSLKLTDTYY